MKIIDIPEQNPKCIIIGQEDVEALSQILYSFGYDKPIADKELHTQIARLFYRALNRPNED